MNVFSPPPRFRWTPEQLANAVPLRLHQMLRFEAPRRHAANAPHGPHRLDGYRTDARTLPAFRIS